MIGVMSMSPPDGYLSAAGRPAASTLVSPMLTIVTAHAEKPVLFLCAIAFTQNGHKHTPTTGARFGNLSRSAKLLEQLNLPGIDRDRAPRYR
jgi:hypothetical protein